MFDRDLDAVVLKPFAAERESFVGELRNIGLEVGIGVGVAREGAQAADDLRDAHHGLLDLGDDRNHGLGAGVAGFDHLAELFRPPVDDGQGVVDLVGDAAGHLTQRRHLGSRHDPELLVDHQALALLPFGDVLEEHRVPELGRVDMELEPTLQFLAEVFEILPTHGLLKNGLKRGIGARLHRLHESIPRLQPHQFGSGSLEHVFALGIGVSEPAIAVQGVESVAHALEDAR